MWRALPLLLSALTLAQPAAAATVRVAPGENALQKAIDAALSGDTILVAPGMYRERVQLKRGIVVKSEGDDSRGTTGLARAEATVIDGAVPGQARPGVLMAEGSTLDGFTITRVGQYDEAVWKQHYDSHGEELGDDEGAVQAEGTSPAVMVRAVNCTVTNCIVHHNGDVGIAILGRDGTKTAPLVAGNVVSRNMGGGIGIADGAEAIVRGNTCTENLRAGIGCRDANPIVTDNTCSQNVRAGIGCRGGSRPVLRGNTCTRNRRAGIGIRMPGTSPIVEGNDCSENELAGIGCRDGASPIVRNNTCRANRQAGIGCRDGARPLIVGNRCRDNETAGIGINDRAEAIVQSNECIDNRQVAIGVIGKATATITDNTLSRAAGSAPIVAVREGSTATIRDNRITGEGVAAVLVQGEATVSGNTFTAAGNDQGNAIWVWEGSTATLADNTTDGYRGAVLATKATVAITGNTIRRFVGTAIMVKESRKPAHVFGNTATSTDRAAKVVDVQGPAGIVAENVLQELVD